MERKVIETKWYNPMGSDCVGIVLVDTGHGLKAYIGIASGIHEEMDTASIMSRGARFHEGPKLWPDRPEKWAS